MKNKFVQKTGSNQMRWVIFLFFVAVILPTVCLLWFMVEAVKNERLAVRQKLVDVYSEKVRPMVETLRQRQLKFAEEVGEVEEVGSFQFFVRFCYEKEYAEGILIYDSNGEIVFPVSNEKAYSLDIKQFEKGWKLEFADGEYVKAAEEYERAIMISSIPFVVFRGQEAMVRCYEKAGDVEKAIKLCRELAYPGEHIVNEYPIGDIFRARLKLVKLYQKRDKAVFEKEVGGLLSDILADSGVKPLGSEVRVFILSELVGLIDKAKLDQEEPTDIDKAEKILAAEMLSLDMVDRLSAKGELDKMQEKRFKAVEFLPETYGMLFTTENRKVFLFGHRSSIVEIFRYMAERISDSTIAVSVFDDGDRLVYGENSDERKGFLTIRPSMYLTEWRLVFFFHNSGVFDEAASRQAGIYIWVGVLVVLLIVFSGGVAVQVIGRQMKLNRLKNDFIATVTHELKTPLASMRVLVDTLLEGRYEDRAQAGEYLGLIAKENVRLTGLIDNFLTFSRMERNKQAFDIESTNPAEIARGAAEAVRTKFAKCRCKLALEIEDNLSSVMADKGAMVTVVVNLLDNACKYSYDDTRIELRVYEEDGEVCFSVADNGIGMSRGAMKKIFTRFYQVDSSLSRQAEGTGLGLSIVKFIVDAHKGSISVDSKVGEGSRFVVRLNIKALLSR